MFSWIKSTMSSKNCLGEFKFQIFPFKKKEKSNSYLSINDLENSMNLEFEDSVFKFKKNKRFTSRIISMFQKKSKKMKKNQSMIDLFNEIMDESLDIDGNEAKKEKCHCCQKKKLFKRVPLDEYAKRKQQIFQESWLRDAPSYSLLCSDNQKIDPNKKLLRSALKTGNNPAICKKKVSFAPLPCEIDSTEVSESEKDSNELFYNRSYFLPRVFENESSFNSLIAMNQDGNAANISTGLKFGSSFDCFTQYLENVRTNEKNVFSYNASEDHEGEFYGELSLESINSMEGLKSARKYNSLNCIPSYIKSALSDTERSASVMTNFVISDSRSFDQTRHVNDVFFNYQPIVEIPDGRVKLEISNSSDEYDDSCFHPIAKFTSFDDLIADQLMIPKFEQLQMDVTPEIIIENEENQQLSFDLDYEQQSNENSYNSSYVISMYV